MSMSDALPINTASDRWQQGRRARGVTGETGKLRDMLRDAREQVLE